MKASLIFALMLSFSLHWRCTVQAQEPVFNRVPPPQGRIFEHITSITQDRNGFMWLASKRGLFKYDGYKMTVYKKNTLNPFSLTSNSLETVFADADGTLWVGSLGTGLDHFDPATGVFTHFRYDAQKPGGLSNDTVTAILRDRQGILWVGTHQGLNRLNEKTRTFTHFRCQPDNPKSLSSNQVRALYEDRQGTLWIGTGSPYADNGGAPGDGGLNRMNKATGSFTRYLNKPGDPQSLASNKVRALFEDSKGNFWVGTGGSDGLQTLDRATGKVQRYAFDPVQPDRLSRPPLFWQFAGWDHVTFIREDATGALWIGTAAAGLSRFDAKTNKLTRYDHGANPAEGNMGDNPWWAYISRDNQLWISTTRGNLYRVDPLQPVIPHSRLRMGSANGFFEEEDGTVWMATARGVAETGPDLQPRKFWLTNADHVLMGNGAMSVAKYKDGFYWVGTWGAGLLLLDKARGTFTRYLYHPEAKGSISGSFVMPMLKDNEGTWWFGTDHGLNRWDPQSGRFTAYLVYPNDPPSLGNNVVTVLHQDRRNRLWVGTWQGGGIHLFSKPNSRFHSYLKGVSITGIQEDKKGVLWVGGSDGLYYYNSSTDDFIAFVDPGTAAGISDVVSLVQDKEGALWVGTSDGLLRIDPQRNETSAYGREYGFSESSLVYGSARLRRNGELLFGDSSGYFAFHPRLLTNAATPPQITFTDLRLADKQVAPGTEGVLPVPLAALKELRLHHNQNIFSVDFAAIDYSNPEKNRQLYQLENYDLTWHKAGAEQRAYYFNVPPGRYIFRVKAVNSKGVWSEKTLPIVIVPPWWQTWWAYSLLALLVTAFVWTLTWYRSRKLQKENAVLEEKVTERTQQLHQSLMDLKAAQSQLIQREKMASLGELTAGIAHEIQNPLNFVNNFADVSSDLLHELEEALLRKDEAEVQQMLAETKKNLQKIHYHGNRAGAIVKNMLQHSRKNEQQKEPTDVNALVEEYLRMCYHGARAKDKQFSAIIETRFDPAVSTAVLNEQEIGRVLLNVFSNAFYAVNERRKKEGNGFDPTIQVATEKKSGCVEIKVRDNGMGIPEKVQEKIYQPFFTTKPTGEGTGLGLSLSYDIVTNGHGGSLLFDTKEGEGTEFIIRLPE